MQFFYSAMRPLLLRLDAETSHHFTLAGLNFLHRYSLDAIFSRRIQPLPINVMGMTFPNPVGLAAGFDKNGAYIDALSGLGFGFLEIGTVTPKPQPGNPKPRLFRFPEAGAVINRMGFNNYGVDAMVENLKRMRYRGILGVNIGKNAQTPIDTAVDDYLICMNKVYPFASYITLNISSPNTKGLRDLQQEAALTQLLTKLKLRQLELADHTGRYVPLVLKIAPDLTVEEIRDIAAMLKRHRVDGVIATNTTLSRDGVQHLPEAKEAGGLSGTPLTNKSTWVIRELVKHLEGVIPVIGVGGISRPNDAWEKIQAGASLVQLYSGLVFQGPKLIGDSIEAVRPNITKLIEERQKQQKAWHKKLAEEDAAAAEAAAAALRERPEALEMPDDLLPPTDDIDEEEDGEPAPVDPNTPLPPPRKLKDIDFSEPAAPPLPPLQP